MSIINAWLKKMFMSGCTCLIQLKQYIMENEQKWGSFIHRSLEKSWDGSELRDFFIYHDMGTVERIEKAFTWQYNEYLLTILFMVALMLH